MVTELDGAALSEADGSALAEPEGSSDAGADADAGADGVAAADDGDVLAAGLHAPNARIAAPSSARTLLLFMPASSPPARRGAPLLGPAAVSSSSVSGSAERYRVRHRSVLRTEACQGMKTRSRRT